MIGRGDGLKEIQVGAEKIAAVGVGAAVVADEITLRRHTRPELDAERCRPACIALQSQNEVRLVIDSKDCNVCHILDYYYYRIRRR